jgi:hypothetical protein
VNQETPPRLLIFIICPVFVGWLSLQFQIFIAARSFTLLFCTILPLIDLLSPADNHPDAVSTQYLPFLYENEKWVSS